MSLAPTHGLHAEDVVRVHQPFVGPDAEFVSPAEVEAVAGTELRESAT
jgi:hypothetical protein